MCNIFTNRISLKGILLFSICLGQSPILWSSSAYEYYQHDNDLRIWLECGSKEASCEQFGLKHVKTTTDSEETGCDPGEERILCESPPAPNVLVNTPAHTLSVLSYNVYEIPNWAFHSGQRERTCRIPKLIAEWWPDLDVIVLQELWMGGCFADSMGARQNNLTGRALLKQHGFPYATETVGPVSKPPESLGTLMNGGIMIASKWPILTAKYHIFEAKDPLALDAVAQKGVVYAKVEKTVSGQGKIYHVLGTHLAYGGSSDVRLYQTLEFREFYRTLGLSSDEPVLFVGDFNMDFINHPDEVQEINSILKITFPPNVGPVPVTHNKSNDHGYIYSGRDSWIDYVMYSVDHQKPVTATQEAFIFQTSEPMHVCILGSITPGHIYPNEPACSRDKYMHDLSDHYPVIGRFVFPG